MASRGSSSRRAMSVVCARLMALHRLEEDLAELPAVEPSEVFIQTVMGRIMQSEPTVVLPSSYPYWETVKYSAIVVGALALITIYSMPAVGESWLLNLWAGGSWLTTLWPSVGPRTVGMLTYFIDHPPWVILLAGVAALLLVLGLVTPESGTS